MAPASCPEHGAHRGPMTKIGRVLGATLAAVLIGLSSPSAGSSLDVARAGGSHLHLPTDLDLRKHPKIDSNLVDVADATVRAGVAAGIEVATGQQLATSNGSVRVLVTASGDRAAARRAIVRVGGRIEAEYADLVQGFVPVGALESLADMPDIRYVDEPTVGHPAAVTDEGVAETNALGWQEAGFTGAGVRVGIIDLGFIGYAGAQLAGDLPAVVTTADFGCGGVATFTNHGTAVAEIVHKMAPDAQLFLICVDTSVDLGNAKDYAIAQGITVVNHSVVWFNTSRGDGSGGAGTPDAIVADARANGILWVNAAGNQAQVHWSGTFFDPNVDGYHDFAANNPFNQIGIGTGGVACVFLKWDNWPVSAQDYDVGLVRMADSEIVAGSVNVQNGSQAPTEEFCYQNPGSAQSFGVVINKFFATATPRFDLFILPGGTLQFAVLAGSVPEPASSPNTMAVGAICWQNDGVESFSGRGPTIDGRIKPDISGQDRTSSAVYGSAGANCTGGFDGTSAAAPHVAGAAALVAEANPGFSPAEIQAFLESHALDLGSVGKDNTFGSGRLWLGTAIPDPATGATFVPLPPARLLDTRSGNGLNGVFSAYTPRTFQVTGQGGVPSDAVAVTGNLTVTEQTKAGYVYLGPNPLANPPSSTLNFPLGDNRANGVTVALGGAGTLSATYAAVGGGSTHLVFDVTGYFVPDASGATFVPLSPARLLDTRSGKGLSGVFSAYTPQTFQVTGQGMVPSDAVAVTGNLTVTEQSQLGFVYLGPDPVANPTSSTLNFPLGDNRANGVTVDLGEAGTLSATYAAVGGGSTHLVFDVTGYFIDDASGATFVPLTPARLLDTRYGNGLSGVFSAYTPRTFQVTGRGGVKASAVAVTGNLTVTEQTKAGYVFLGPDPVANPTSSTLNFPLGDNRANGVTVALGGAGTLSATYGAVGGGSTHLVFDVTGYFR
jgi:serine protease inhibitor ecotin